MSRFLPFLLIVIFYTSSFKPVDDIAEIKTVLLQQAAEWNKGNIDGYMKGYWNNDSLQFIGRNGPVYGYQTTLERYKKSYPGKEIMGQLEFSELTFRKLCEGHYYVTGKYALSRETGNASGYFALLFKKIAGKWVIVADHSS